MKRFGYRHSQLIVALTLALAATLACERSYAATPVPATSRLIIRRAPNLGIGLFVNVSIDGRKVADVGYGQTYTGYLSPGQHVVSVILRPNQLFLRPTQTNLTVAPGRTYVLTVMWEGQQVVLR